MKKKRLSGFSLVEVTLALGICAFCLISLVGLLPAGLSASSNASRQSEATAIAESFLADLQSSGTMDFVPETGPTIQVLRRPSPSYQYDCVTTPSVNFIPADASANRQGMDGWRIVPGAGFYRVTVEVSPSPSSNTGPYTFAVTVQWPGGANATDSTVRQQGSVTLVGRSSSIFK